MSNTPTIKEIGRELKKLFMGIRIVSQLFPIGYLVYIISNGLGSQVLNIILLSLSVLHFLFFLFMELRNFNKRKKRAIKKWVNFAYRWSKRLIKLQMIIVPSYGVFVTSKEFSPLALILLLLTILGLALEILFHILIKMIKKLFYPSEETFSYKKKRDWKATILNFFKRPLDQQQDDPDDFSDLGEIRKE